MDNKCYYEVIFPEVKRLRTIANRMNKIWYIENKPVAFEEVLEEIKNKELFIKVATDSEGGAGGFYLPANSDTRKAGSVIKKVDTDIVIQEVIQ